MKMKKNLVFRLGLLALVLTLVTMPLVSGTYAKYVTSEVGEATARVAKWGVEITGLGGTNQDGMFSETYATDVAVENEIETSVEASANVVAPGTSGDFGTIEISGAPEVAVNLKKDVVFELTGNWIMNDEENYYAPIKITINEGEDNEEVFYGLDYEYVENFQDAVIAALNYGGYAEDNDENVGVNYVPNTDLSGYTIGTISWEWAFESDNGDKVNASDAADTYLGNWVLRNENVAPTITLGITITVTQID